MNFTEEMVFSVQFDILKIYLFTDLDVCIDPYVITYRYHATTYLGLLMRTNFYLYTAANKGTYTGTQFKRIAQCLIRHSQAINYSLM